MTPDDLKRLREMAEAPTDSEAIAAFNKVIIALLDEVETGRTVAFNAATERDEQRARAEAAEAEVERLRAALLAERGTTAR